MHIWDIFLLINFWIFTGCTESSSATSCFACKHLTQTLRNKGGSGFKCVQKCDDTYYLDGDKCKMCSSHCHTCTKAEVFGDIIVCQKKIIL